MKKTLFLKAAAVIILSAACSGKQQKTGTEDLYNPAEILNVFKKVLNSETMHFDTEKEQSILLKDYFEENNATAGDIKFAIVDLDGDGIPEVAIEHFPGIIRVLRYENEKVNGFSFGFRGMSGLKKDGSFNWSNSAFHSGIGRQIFMDKNSFCFHLAEGISDPDDGKENYFVYYNTVGYRQYEAFSNIHNQKEDVEWISFSTENVNNLKVWDNLKYFYSSIPDKMFPIPKRNGQIISYNEFSPPEEGYIITQYLYKDVSIKELYKQQLKDAGFEEQQGAPEWVESLWRYDRKADGASLMVEIIQEENLAIQMYVNYPSESSGDVANDEQYVQNVILPNVRRIEAINNWTRIDEKETWDLSVEGAELKYYHSEKGLEKITAEIFGEYHNTKLEYYFLDGQLSFHSSNTVKYPENLYSPDFDPEVSKNTYEERQWYIKDERWFGCNAINDGKILTPNEIEDEELEDAMYLFNQIKALEN